MTKKVVVIGGGFAGSSVAQQLEKKFDVTLIDTKGYFEFTPGILRTIVEPEHIKKIQALHSHYLKRAKVIVGKVCDLNEKEVFVDKMNMADNMKIKFDYLVISSGSAYDSPFKESNVITATRANNLRNCYDDLCLAKRVVIIGGGLVGVELAGEICWKYGDDKKITIIHNGDKLISRNNRKARSYAEKYLKKHGVKYLFNENVVEKKGKICYTDKGKEIEADIVFLCTGIKPNFDFVKGEFKKILNDSNQITVNEYLQVVGFRNIFAAGDITDRIEEKTAQNAERQSHIVVHNIKALEKDYDRKLCKYYPRMGPMVISLGPSHGIFTKNNFTWTGILPGKLKGILEWLIMRKKR
jgi:apoptosis-inducing factor 2